jgi:ABC-type branched-subunit amino acid transport system substrate-binding protein
MRRLVLAVVVLALAACQQSKPGRIGILTALTGTQQAFGQATRGVDLLQRHLEAVESNWPGSARFTEKFKAKYGSTPAYHAVQAYSALKVMVDAVKRAGK